MFNSKYSKVLTVVLVVVIIAIVCLLIFLGYSYYKEYKIDKDNKDFMDQYENQLNSIVENTQVDDINTVNNEVIIDPEVDLNTVVDPGTSEGSSGTGVTYKGFNVVGKIEIPKTNIKYPILEEASGSAIEVAVGVLYGPGPNKIGNTVIVGHNYRNGQFFSNNKKLAVGDKIYITDNSGKKVTYTIYKKYETTPQDFAYASRDTNGKREVSLSTCTDDVQRRIIIWAKED